MCSTTGKKKGGVFLTIVAFHIPTRRRKGQNKAAAEGSQGRAPLGTGPALSALQSHAGLTRQSDLCISLSNTVFAKQETKKPSMHQACDLMTQGGGKDGSPEVGGGLLGWAPPGGNKSLSQVRTTVQGGGRRPGPRCF